MFNKKTITLLFVVIILLILLLLVTMIGEKTQNNDVLSSGETDEFYIKGYVFDLDTDLIDDIYIKTSSESFHFAKKDDIWYMPDNLNASISSATVSMLVGTLNNISYTDTAEDNSIKPEDCGITDSADYIKFSCGKDEYVLKRGIDSTDRTFTYVMTGNSDIVYFADYNVVSQIFAPLSSYRNSASLSVDFDSLKTIKIKNDELTELKKGTADSDNAVYNQWKMIVPASIGANDEAIKTKIIEPLRNIKIVSFASDSGNFSDFSLGGKDRYIYLADNHGKAQTLYFSSSADGKYYISIDEEKTIYEVDRQDAPYIFVRPIDLADRNLNLAKMSNISNVTIKGTGIDLNIEFLENGGKINGTHVDNDVMNQKVFTNICGLMADDIYTGNTKSGEITMIFNYKTPDKDTIIFWSYNDRYYAVSKNGVAKYLILKTKISDMISVLEGIR